MRGNMVLSETHKINGLIHSGTSWKPATLPTIPNLAALPYSSLCLESLQKSQQTAMLIAQTLQRDCLGLELHSASYQLSDLSK